MTTTAIMMLGRAITIERQIKRRSKGLIPKMKQLDGTITILHFGCTNNIFADNMYGILCMFQMKYGIFKQQILG